MTDHDENRVTRTFPTPEQLATWVDRCERLRKELEAALGHMLNARIDLETGRTKAMAIDTLERGVKRAREALEDTK